MVYAMSFGSLPFDANDAGAMHRMVTSTTLTFPLTPARAPELLQLISDLLQVDPALRPSVDWILESAIVKAHDLDHQIHSDGEFSQSGGRKGYFAGPSVAAGAAASVSGPIESVPMGTTVSALSCRSPQISTLFSSLPRAVSATSAALHSPRIVSSLPTFPQLPLLLPPPSSDAPDAEADQADRAVTVALSSPREAARSGDAAPPPVDLQPTAASTGPGSDGPRSPTCKLSVDVGDRDHSALSSPPPSADMSVVACSSHFSESLAGSLRLRKRSKSQLTHSGALEPERIHMQHEHRYGSVHTWCCEVTFLRDG